MCELQWLFGVLTLVLLLDQAVVRPFFILAPLPIVGQCMMGIMVAISGDEAGCVTLHSIIAVQVGGSSAGRSGISSERRRDAKDLNSRVGEHGMCMCITTMHHLWSDGRTLQRGGTAFIDPPGTLDTIDRADSPP